MEDEVEGRRGKAQSRCWRQKNGGGGVPEAVYSGRFP